MIRAKPAARAIAAIACALASSLWVMERRPDLDHARPGMTARWERGLEPRRKLASVKDLPLLRLPADRGGFDGATVPCLVAKPGEGIRICAQESLPAAPSRDEEQAHVSHAADTLFYGIIPELLQLAADCAAKAPAPCRTDASTLAALAPRADEAPQEKAARSLALVRAQREFEKYRKQTSGLPGLVSGVQRLRGALREEVDPREAYLQCFGSSDPRFCYLNLVSEAFDSVAWQYTPVLGEILAVERRAFINANSYEGVSQQVEKFYGAAFSGAAEPLEHRARALWERCQTASEPASTFGIPKLTPFSGKSLYLSAGLLECLNTGADAELDGTVSSHARELGLALNDRAARAFVRELLTPVLTGSLQELADHAAAVERQEREWRKGSVVEVLAGGLLANTEWLQGPGEPHARCADSARLAFDRYFGKVQAGEGLAMRFVPIEEVRRDWTTEVCRKVIASQRSVSGK